MKPLKNKKRKAFPPLAVFDIESTSWTKVKIVCHVDEFGNRKRFRTVAAYLQWLLSKFEGDHVWSHFGSGFDNRFLIDESHKWSGTSYKAIMSGGQPIIFVVQNSGYLRKNKKGKDSERQITLLDSFRLLPSSLAKIGASLNMPKMDVDRARINELSFTELSEYCFSDCDILLAGLQRFRNTIEAEGGNYSATSASIASNFIRADPSIHWREFFEPDSNYQRYSGESYAMGYPGSKPGLLQADDFCIGAYYGGRCEVVRYGVHQGPLYLYDIASAYPWAMRQALPLYFRGFHPGAKWEESKRLSSILNACGVSDAFVTIPTGTYDLPILPMHSRDGKVVFAEGKVRGRWTNAELLALYKRRKPGVRIEISGWAKFEPAAFARSLVDRFYSLRREAKDAGDEAQSMIYKILLNACYGRLVQQMEQSSYVYGDAYEFMRNVAEDEGRLKPTLIADVFEIVEQSEGTFRHVAAGAYVTALARLRLLEGIEYAVSCGARVYYCDTDSIIVDRPIAAWGGSTELGSWELESVFDEAEFLCPKVYRAYGKKGLVLKAKGSNLKSQLPLTASQAVHDRERLLRWCVYASHISPWARQQLAGLSKAELRYYGTAEAGLKGWRTSLKQGSLTPTVSVLDRQARSEDSKRRHLGQGETMPLYIASENGEFVDVREPDDESLEQMEEWIVWSNNND